MSENLTAEFRQGQRKVSQSFLNCVKIKKCAVRYNMWVENGIFLSLKMYFPFIRII